jgi:hypothetical protein
MSRRAAGKVKSPVNPSSAFADTATAEDLLRLFFRMTAL